ncbi:exopolyphosphatase [bacterium]|nr:exopolyphosphatase [bacterium]
MRLFTRADLDGIVSAALMKAHEPITDVVFVHPKMMQDGKVDVASGDAIANLPFHPNAAIWFDHHITGTTTVPEGVKGECSEAPSAARLIYRHYGGNGNDVQAMLEQTDKLDSADLSYQDILHPTGWILLGFMLDPRSGLNLEESVLNEVIDAITSGRTIDEILAIPSIKQASERYIEDEEQNKILLVSNTKLKRNIVINDLRKIETMPAGNRFTIYAIFPRCSINIRLFRHATEPKKVVAAVGKSIFYRNHPLHIGDLMREYGGGGLEGAGSCQFFEDEVDSRLKELMARLRT